MGDLFHGDSEKRYGAIIDSKEYRQMQSDVQRCVNLHPIMRSELVQLQVVRLIATFMAIYPELVYIQGLDSIVVVLYI